MAYLVQEIRDCVKHIYRERNQDADHMANWRTAEVSKISVEIVKIFET